MSSKPKVNFFELLNSKSSVKTGILILTGSLTLLLMLMPFGSRQPTLNITTGEVTPKDIIAPQSIKYTSDVLTKDAQANAEKSVLPVYLPIDLTITRQQLTHIQNVLKYINNVLNDPNSTREDKLSDLAALSDIRLNNDTAVKILNLDSGRWSLLEQETLRVFEQVMRNPVRDYQIEETRQQIPSYISFAIPEDQSNIITELIRPFITANSIFSEGATIEARIKARSNVTPITRSFIQGETVIDHGRIVTSADIEALEHLGLVKPQTRIEDVLSTLSIVTLCTVFAGLYFNRRRFYLTLDARSTLAIGAVFLLFMAGAQLAIPGRVVLPYLYPMAAFGLTMACLFNVEIGLIFSIIISFLGPFATNNSPDISIYYAMSSLCGILILGRGYRMANFFWSGIVIGCAGAASIISFRLSTTSVDLIGIATLVGAAFINGLASASIALIFQFLFSQLLGLTTALRLMDLSRPDHPLLQYILFNAPGTYQHSLQVANLAERAAESIGADTLLVRVGALYHDAGKAVNPLYFIENQIPGSKNPHEDLDPITSASIIIKHVPDGISLAKKHRLPSRIQDFIVEHHGNLLTRYQYSKALEKTDEQNIDQSLFRYKGTKPRSKETAILMLADGCEAKSRAEHPEDEKELRILIKKVFDYLQQNDQLTDTALTLRDLSIISESFYNTLKNTHHPRIPYPEPAPQPIVESKNATTTE
jgi:putative nucleotidyltransferase with HDIG domain